jgi:arylsulfatase A-like enzyme
MRPLSRRTRILLVACASLSAAACAPEPPRRPNVILVSIDTLRADHLGAWGYPRGTSPHLDRLARRGATFARCIAQAASTMPSHRSLFQSRVASHTGREFPMLAELLQSEGWSTVAFTGGGNVSAELGFSAGFDTYEESEAGLPWSVASLIDWRRDRANAPYFAFLHGYDVHVPYDAPAPFSDLFDPSYEGRVRGSDTRALCRAIRGLDDDGGAPPAVDLDAADRHHLEALYDGGIRAVDDALGRLLEWVASGDAGEALVVVVSDHGEEFWDHGTVLHSHTVYQELVHVPLLVSGMAQGRPGVVLEGTVRNLDVTPTILDALDVDELDVHEGASLAPRVRGEGGPNLPAISEMKQWKAILEWPWKLVVDVREPSFSLYRLDTDPGETRDVAGEHPDAVRALEAALVAASSRAAVRELSSEERTPELEERLRALGYIN